MTQKEGDNIPRPPNNPRVTPDVYITEESEAEREERLKQEREADKYTIPLKGYPPSRRAE